MPELSSLLTKKKILLIFGIVLLTSVVSEIWVSNRLATLGDQLTKIEQAKTDLTLENQLLNDQISGRESIERAREYATLLGFSDIKNVLYIQTASSSGVVNK